MNKLENITIIGLGLIGGSIASAISANKIGKISAYDNNHQTLEYALQNGIAYAIYNNAKDAIKDADIIIFSCPPSQFEKIMQEIFPFIKKGAIITDVASIKLPAIAAITKYLPEGVHFIPAHPIAGSEKFGVQASNKDLFTGKKVILTPNKSQLNNQSVSIIRNFWEKIGSKVEFMPPELHDEVYAYISHLPQIIAFSMQQFTANLPNEEIYIKFKRLAGSNPELWADICIANAEPISRALCDFIMFLTQIMGELAENPQSKNNNAEPLFAQLIATSIIATASLLQEQRGVNPVYYAGTGFADMTAPAKISSAQIMLEAISENNKEIIAMLKIILQKLNAIHKQLNKTDHNELQLLFSQ